MTGIFTGSPLVKAASTDCGNFSAENVIPVDFRLRAGELLREPMPTDGGAA